MDTTTQVTVREAPPLELPPQYWRYPASFPGRSQTTDDAFPELDGELDITLSVYIKDGYVYIIEFDVTDILKQMSEEYSLFENLSQTAFDGNDSVFSEHIIAKQKMISGGYLDAYHILKQLLSTSDNIPAPMLYFVFTDLEICCRELSDYRGAYEYSSDRTGMLEKFLG